MELLFSQDMAVENRNVNQYGNLKLSALLYYAQEAAGGHCKLLGFDWDTMAAKNLFWAVLRHRVIVHRLPKAGETITVQTWPLPATRSAYPRAVRALDSDGNILFDVISLWVLMNPQTRTMVLPGKSGVDVPGIIRGDEPALPGSLIPGVHENHTTWVVSADDLDINGHVNNAKYLDHAEALAGDFQKEHCPREFTVCYLAESLLNQEITLGYTLSEDSVLTVDGIRPRTDDPEKTERVFAVKISF